jgi:hypothetical protein
MKRVNESIRSKYRRVVVVPLWRACVLLGALLILAVRAHANIAIGGPINPVAGLDVATGGSASALIVPRDTTANRPAVGVNGMLRYNTSANALETFVNGGWMQITTQPLGSTTGVTVSGPPVSAGVYTFSSVSANYTPGYGAVANTWDGNWPANGSGDYQMASCVQIQSNSTKYITYDLGSVKSIGNVYVSIGEDLTLAVLFSTDGTNFTNSTTIPYTGSGGTMYIPTALTPVQSARYIRATYANGQNPDFQPLCEIAVGP